MFFHLLYLVVLLHSAYPCPTNLQMQPCQCKEDDSYYSKGPIKILRISCKNVQVDRVGEALSFVAQTEKPVSLTLENTELKNLPSQFLVGLHLLSFVAEHCNLSTVDEYAFSDATDTLEAITLDNNNLERVPTGSLNKLRSLRYLYLNYNRLEVLHADSFKGIHSLLVLSLQGNRLKLIDDLAFEIGSQFEYIFLGENELTAFPSRPLSRPGAIKHLSIENNKIASLQPEEMSTMSGGSLEKLWLMNNRIRHIPARTFNSLKSLKGLVLAVNEIESIDPLAFEGIGGTLDFLSVAENLLNEVPAASLRNMRRLEYLHLEGNRICTVRKDDFVSYGRRVKRLDLGNNSLTYMDPMSLVSLNSLEDFTLRDNLLNTLPYETYAPVLDTLKELDIAGNPLHCDCEIAWLKDLQIRVQTYRTKCVWPEEYADVALDAISKSSLVCRNSTSKPPLLRNCRNEHAESETGETIALTPGYSENAEMNPASSSHRVVVPNACIATLQITYFAVGVFLQSRMNFWVL